MGPSSAVGGDLCLLLLLLFPVKLRTRSRIVMLRPSRNGTRIGRTRCAEVFLTNAVSVNGDVS